MNIEEANNLISQICNFNKIFFEEHLGIRWEPPDLNILDHSNLEALQKSNQMHPSVHPHKAKQCDTKIIDIVNGSDKWKMLQLIFEKIPGFMNYLMDKDIAEILKLCEMSEKGKKLAQLDNVFTALGIEDSENLSKLLENLLLFAYCPHRDDRKVVEIHQQTFIENGSTSASLTSEISEKNFDPIFAQGQPVDSVSIELDLETEMLVEEGKGKTEKNVPHASIDLDLRKKQIELLWNRYRMIFPEEHIHMWSSLEPGLADYLLHLKKRFQLHMECDKLRRQNAQLKYMLQELL